MTDSARRLLPEEKLLRAIFGKPVGSPRCRDEINGVTLRQAIEVALSNLPPRAVEIIRIRFGFNDPLGRGRTCAETGRAFGVTGERIRQIEAKALRQLRHPSRSGQLKLYFEE